MLNFTLFVVQMKSIAKIILNSVMYFVYVSDLEVAYTSSSI